uniref:uncharacterized protein LOC118551575 isoform X4 n=1 Tax=Halichoerus grypus TaxID=9711 RepID=UPI001659F696|nr:uncharacterized protein LOC118551575 isoform X4 [Halichoerus grypus]
MASLEKAGVFLKRLFRHHITVPDGREVLALTWLPSLGNALDQTALLGCFCLRKVSCVNTKNLSSKRLALESESFMWEGFVRKCFMTRWSQESGDFRVRSSWQEAPSPSLTSGSPGQPLLGCHRHQSVSLEVHAAQITLEQRNRSLLQFRGRGPVPEWAVVVQTHLMSGWPKALPCLLTEKGEPDTALGLWGFSLPQPYGGTVPKNLPEHTRAQHCGTVQQSSGLFRIVSDLGWPWGLRGILVSAQSCLRFTVLDSSKFWTYLPSHIIYM